MTNEQPIIVHQLRPRSWSAEIRHTLGSVGVIVAPSAELFDLISLRVFGFALVASLLLLVSTIQPPPTSRR